MILGLLVMYMLATLLALCMAATTFFAALVSSRSALLLTAAMQQQPMQRMIEHCGRLIQPILTFLAVDAAVLRLGGGSRCRRHLQGVYCALREGCVGGLLSALPLAHQAGETTKRQETARAKAAGLLHGPLLLLLFCCMLLLSRLLSPVSASPAHKISNP